MNITVQTTDIHSISAPVLVIGLFEGDQLPSRLHKIDSALSGTLTQALHDREFNGKAGELLLVHSGKRLSAERILLTGLGTNDRYSTQQAQLAIASAATYLQNRKLTDLAIDLCSFTTDSVNQISVASAATEGLSLSAYRYDTFRIESAKDLPPLLKSAVLIIDRSDLLASTEEAVTTAQIISNSVCLARDLVNAPGNIKSPRDLAERCQTEGISAGCHCTILHHQTLIEEGMGALLGVAQGSSREPCMIVLEYRGAGDSAPIALVGKAVVFDSGGISLKPAEKMDEMKMDMAGGAAVLGILTAAAQLKLSVNLVGIIPAVENLPSGHAIRPGDILTSMSKKTIEVLNTDAEGRLILADAITYALRYKPSAMIDLATLTGACIIALGHEASAILGNDQQLIDQLIRAGEVSNERLWQLPLWGDYDKLLKSDVADIKNSGGRPAGTITGAAFLKSFAGNCPWAHLDIAGTAWEGNGRPGTPKGGTGVGVRLLIEYLRGVEPSGL